jgi:hypothetical protein
MDDFESAGLEEVLITVAVAAVALTLVVCTIAVLALV